MLIFIRHGQSQANADITDNPDSALTEKGIEQVNLAVLDLRKLNQQFAIVSSPYQRTKQTADIIAEKLNFPVTLDKAFREHPSEHPNSEDTEHHLLVDLKQALPLYREGNIIIVSHFRTIKLALGVLYGVYPKELIVPNAKVLIAEQEQFRII